MPVTAARRRPTAAAAIARNRVDAMATAMSTDEFAKAVRDSERAESLEIAHHQQRRPTSLHVEHHVDLHKPLDRIIEAVREALHFHAPWSVDELAAVRERLASGTPDERMAAMMSTDAFAKAVRDSEQAEAAEIAHHQARHHTKGIPIQEKKAQLSSKLNRVVEAVKEALHLTAADELAALRQRHGALDEQMAAAMSTDAFAKAVRDSEKAEAAEIAHHQTRHHTQGVNLHLEEAPSPSKLDRAVKAVRGALHWPRGFKWGANELTALRQRMAQGTPDERMAAAMSTDDFAKAVRDSERAEAAEVGHHQLRHATTAGRGHHMADVASPAKLHEPLDRMINAMHDATHHRAAAFGQGGRADRMAHAMSTSDFLKAVRDSERAEALEVAHHQARRPTSAGRMQQEDHPTQHSSVIKTLQKPLDRVVGAVRGAMHLHGKPDESTLMRRRLGSGGPDARMAAAMSSGEFAKAVRDSERALELEEAHHLARGNPARAAAAAAARQAARAPTATAMSRAFKTAIVPAAHAIVPGSVRGAFGRLAFHTQRALRRGLSALHLALPDGHTAADESTHLASRVRAAAARAPARTRPAGVMRPLAAAATAAALIALSMAGGNFLKNLEVPRAAGAVARFKPHLAALRGLNAARDAAGSAASSALSNLQPLALKLRNLAGPAVASRLSPLASLTGLGQTNKEWFRSLNRPFWLLPQPVIGLIWTALYLSMGAALYRLLVRPSMRVGDRVRALAAWGAQIAFATLWGLAVFALRSPALGAVYSMAYLGLVAAATRACAAFDKQAGRYMLPMVLWIGLSTIPTALALVFKN